MKAKTMTRAAVLLAAACALLALWMGAAVAHADEEAALAAAQPAGFVSVQDVQAAGDHASVNLVQELVGRQWVAPGGLSAAGVQTKLAEGDSFTYELVPLGRAAYDEQGNLITVESAEKDAAGTPYRLVDRERGLVPGTAGDVPLPHDASGAEQRRITVTSEGAVVSASQRHASFGDITPVTSHFVYDGSVAKVDYLYDLVQVVPDDAVAVPLDGDGSGTPATFRSASAGGVTVYERDPAGDPVTYAQATAEGVQGFDVDAYEWVRKGVAYTGESREVRVNFTSSGSKGAHVSYDGHPFGSYVPVFANDYDASGRSWAHIVAHLDGRDFDADDRFSYGITNVGGSIMRPTDGTQGDVSLATMTHITRPMQLASDDPEGDPGYGVHLAADQRLNQEVEGGEMVILTGEGRFHSYDLNEQGEGLFVYAIAQFGEVTEAQGAGFTVDRVPDLEYDQSTVYLRYHVKDNADGTLLVQANYYENAACTVPLTVGADRHEPVIWISTENGEPLDQAGIRAAEALAANADAAERDAALEAAGYAQVETAYFRNIRTVAVPVKKVWEGTPVDDVTVHLERALFDSELTDDQIEDLAENAETAGSVDWERIGLTTVLKRGDFLNSDGTPRGNAGPGVSSVTYGGGADDATTFAMPARAGFNDALPLYVVVDGVTKRAAYRLVEDDTSDAYEPSYRSEEPTRAPKEGDNIFVDSGTQVVVNRVTATNTANIAAVSQLMGRAWLQADAFEYRLEPLGRATYDAQGEMVTEQRDGKAVAVLAEGSAASIPMPAAAHAEAPAGTAADVAVATVGTSTVAVGEHLARFGSIRFDTSQLVHDSVDQHLQGDFFYRLKAVAKEGAAAQGVEYDAKESIVHVRVRENRTNTLQVTVAYDEADQSNTATGTQFTPVFTNYYDAESHDNVSVNAYVMGRDWSADDRMDFTLRAMSGAAFVPWRADDQVRLDHDGLADDGNGTMRDEDYWLELGRQVVTRDGALKMRVAPGASAGTQDVLVGAFAQMRFDLDDLHYAVGADGAKDPRDTAGGDGQICNAHGPAAEGLHYGRFSYAVNQSKVASAAGDLLRDEDTEYAQVVVVDNGDGTLHSSVAIYEDRYGAVPRYTPDLANPDKKSDVPATAVTFVGKATRTVEVRKQWVGVVDADVTVQLQATTAADPAEADWADVPGRAIVFAAEDLEPTADGAKGEGSFSDLPMFQADSDDIDLNDQPLAYRVREVSTGGFVSTYGPEGASSPVVAEPGVLQVVTNRSTYDANGTADISVVVELSGREWLESDVFEFDVVPLGKGAYDENGNLNLTDGKVNADTLVTKEAAGGGRVPDASLAKMPTTPAYARAGEGRITASQRMADFGQVELNLSDMTRLPDGRMVGDYFYRIVENVPDDARAWVETGADDKYAAVSANGLPMGAEGAADEQLLHGGLAAADQLSDEVASRLVWERKGVRYDLSQHELRIHFEDAGSGVIVDEEFYDGKSTLPTVPVFLNTYDAAGSNKAHVIKRIEGRDWRADDRFEFSVTAVGGAAFDPKAGQAGTGTDAGVWTTPVLGKGTPGSFQLENGDMARVTGQGTFRLADLTPGEDGAPAHGAFVYQVQEIDPSNPLHTVHARPTLDAKVADLDYDDGIVYLRISVTDNLDGTLSTRNEYFRDAACLEPLADEDGNPYTLWVDENEDPVAAGTPGAEEVPAAFFCNEPAATGQVSVAAVEQLVGRVWLDPATDARTARLVPLGRAEYDAQGAVQTVDYDLNGATVKMAKLVEGSAATIPMPDGSQGEGADRVATASATRDTEPVGEGEHLATFADLRFDLSDLEYNVADRRQRADFYYLLDEDPASAAGGLALDGRAHLVHVSVSESGPNVVGCYVFYDERDAASTATGSQTAPVFTVRYAASGSASVAVVTSLSGSDWQGDEQFDYEMRAMGGAPFFYDVYDAESEQGVVQLDAAGQSGGKAEEAWLAGGVPVATSVGALKMRMVREAPGNDPSVLEGVFPALNFKTDALGWQVGPDGAADPGDRNGARVVTYSDERYDDYDAVGGVVPEGMAYGKFTYAVNQVPGADDAMSYDTETEYAQVLVIDRGDGTLDVSVHIYNDRYGTDPRWDAGNGLAVTAAQFVNAVEGAGFVTARATVAWKDAQGTAVDPPIGARVPLQLVGMDDGAVKRVDTATASSRSTGDAWTATWSVPKDYAYSLTAGLVDGYYVESVEGPGTGDAPQFQVTMKALGSEAPNAVTAGVAWDDSGNVDKLRASFQLKLQGRVAGGAWEDVDEPKDVTAGQDAQSVEWNGLSAADQYRVAAVGVPEGYECTVSQTAPGAFSVRCAHAEDTVSVRATLEWLDLDAADRPKSLDLALRRSGSADGASGFQQVGHDESVTAASNGGWTYLWRNLPANDVQAGTWAYDVACVSHAGYDVVSTTEELASGKLVSVTLRLQSRSATKTVRANLVWQDAAGNQFQPGAANPTPTVGLQLMKVSGTNVAPVPGADRAIAANSAAGAEWTDLPAYEDGHEVFYSVSQVGLAGFSSTYVPGTEVAGVTEALFVNRATGQKVALAAPVVQLSGATGLVYDGKAKTPRVTGVSIGGQAVPASGYAVRYANNVKAGTATVTVVGQGLYSGSASTTFTIAKAKQPLVAKAKKVVVKWSKVRKKAQSVARKKAIAVSKNQGKVAYKKVKGNKKIAVNAKTGKITVKKGLKKGTYKVKVRVTAKGTANYAAGSKTVALKIRVK